MLGVGEFFSNTVLISVHTNSIKTIISSQTALINILRLDEVIDYARSAKVDNEHVL